MFKIAKQFDFCYGHSVWKQMLDADLSCNSACKCKHQHGHQGTIIIYLEGDELDDRGMFLDFNELTWFKKWLDDTLDHKMIIDYSDPARQIFYPASKDIIDLNYDESGYFYIRPEVYRDLSFREKEIYEGLVIVPFVPTSENLSKWIWEIVNKRIGHLCKVSQIQFFETPKSQSNFYAK